MTEELATEATKTALENSVSWFLAEKLGSSTIPIASAKYLTQDNLLVYLTRCDTADTSAPRIKVQVFQRAPDGVHEVNYQLFMDHRFVKSENNMIFGTAETEAANTSTDVSEQEGQQLVQIVNGLVNAAPML